MTTEPAWEHKCLIIYMERKKGVLQKKKRRTGGTKELTHISLHKWPSRIWTRVWPHWSQVRALHTKQPCQRINLCPKTCGQARPFPSTPPPFCPPISCLPLALFCMLSTPFTYIHLTAYVSLSYLFMFVVLFRFRFRFIIHTMCTCTM